MRSVIQGENVVFYSSILYAEKDFYKYEWIVDGFTRGNTWKFEYTWKTIGEKTVKLVTTNKANKMSSENSIKLFVKNTTSFISDENIDTPSIPD